MARGESWLALVDVRDAPSVLAHRFGVTACATMGLSVAGLGYRRWPGLDPSLAGGLERYRTLVLAGNPWGVDTSLFRWSAWSRLIPLPDRLGVSLECWPGVPGAMVLPWRVEGSSGWALNEYLGRLALGGAGLWASLATQEVTRRTIDDVCVAYRQAAVPAYVGATLYSDEYVLDRRVGGPFPAVARGNWTVW